MLSPLTFNMNTSTFVGLQTGGLAGAAAATLGCVFSGFVISLILCRCFERYRQSAYGQQILKGLKAASIGLILSAAMTIFVIAFASNGSELAESTDPIKKLAETAANLNWTAVAVFAAALILIRKVRLNPVLVLALCGIAGGIAYL